MQLRPMDMATEVQHRLSVLRLQEAREVGVGGVREAGLRKGKRSKEEEEEKEVSLCHTCLDEIFEIFIFTEYLLYSSDFNCFLHKFEACVNNVVVSCARCEVATTARFSFSGLSVKCGCCVRRQRRIAHQRDTCTSTRQGGRNLLAERSVD